MTKIGIIGGGFSGTMTAVHLMKQASSPLEIVIINESESFNKGIAFNPYSKKHLLNVATAKMSAIPAEPEHFLNWVMQQENYANKDRNIVAGSFLPRYLYGEYLASIWGRTIQESKNKNITITPVNASVLELSKMDGKVTLHLSTNEKLEVDACVIASGNQVPRNPVITNTAFYGSKNYFQNPWSINSVSGAGADKPVLIIGNGLTMVDTVMGLLEHKFENEIYSISPNGFNILPHRHNGINYTKFVEELTDDASLLEIVRLFRKHLKLIHEFGLSAEPLIDSLRPYTQKIWQRLSIAEKKMFMAKLRHLWGVARHRIPLHIFEKMQQLRLSNKLHIAAGKLKNISENSDGIHVTFYNKKKKQEETIIVSRVINCTGPETDLLLEKDNYLKDCMIKGLISQDTLKLGINADLETLQVLDKEGKKQTNIFTMGSYLKGMLWESTAVPELRVQAEQLAKSILKEFSN